MLKKRLMTGVAVLAAGGLLLVGCAPGASGGSGDEVIIGSSLPLTGPLEAFGNSLKLGYEKAIEEANEAGGVEVDGAKRSLRLVVQDNGTDGDKAAEQARSLVLDDGAIALLGPATPPLSIPVSAVAEQLKVPAVVSVTPLQAWKSGNPDGWTYVWDAFFDENQMKQIQFQAADLIETNKKVALFTDTDEDGKVMGGLWEQTAPKFGYEVVSHSEFVVGNTNFTSQVAEARAAGADVVISMAVAPDSIALLKEMKSQGYQPKAVFLEKGGDTGGLVELSEGLAEGTLATNWFAAGMGDRSQEFIDEYSEQLGGVNADMSNLIFGYSIAQVLIQAIERAGSLDPDAVNEEIGKTDAVFPAGAIRFADDNTATLPAVQTQWVGNDQVLVLDVDGQATDTAIVSPPAGLN